MPRLDRLNGLDLPVRYNRKAILSIIATLHSNATAVIYSGGLMAGCSLEWPFALMPSCAGKRLDSAAFRKTSR